MKQKDTTYLQTLNQHLVWKILVRLKNQGVTTL